MRYQYKIIMASCTMGIFCIIFDISFISAYLPDSLSTLIEENLHSTNYYTTFAFESKNDMDVKNDARDLSTSTNYLGNMTDLELQNLSEILFKKDVNNAGKYVVLNYQGKTQPKLKDDLALEPLLTMNKEVWNIPTISAVKALYDNYEQDSRIEETVTNQEISEEFAFLDAIMATSLMRSFLSALNHKGLIPSEYAEQKSFLRNMWFGLYPRSKGKLTSSGFEHVFLSEIKRRKISGLHNWLYFFTQEEKKNANYLGYLNKVDLNSNNSILKMSFILNGIQKPVGSMFVGFSPELEIAIYSLCFLTRPNKRCPISIAGHLFNVKTYTYKYNGNNLIGSAYPDI